MSPPNFKYLRTITFRCYYASGQLRGTGFSHYEYEMQAALGTAFIMLGRNLFGTDNSTFSGSRLHGMREFEPHFLF